MSRLIVALALALCASVASAQTACPEFFPGAAPAVDSASLSPKSAERDFCFQGYAIAYSARWKDPIWSAEHITKASAQLAIKNPRVGDFHQCLELDPSERSTDADYARSGYQRGHMTPVGDFGDPALEKDTFRFCNMVPQAANLNTKVWAGIEEGVLNWALTEGDVYVVTGPIVPAAAKIIGAGVAVPTHTWKAVYSPKSGASAYLCSNVEKPVCSMLSVANLARLVGVDPFPDLPTATKAALITLPQPTKFGPILH